MKKTTIEAGKSLRHLRTLSGLTLDQVAESAAISASYLSKVESGQKVASPQWIAHVASVVTSLLQASDSGDEKAVA